MSESDLANEHSGGKHRTFIMQVVRPRLGGLMDDSVSTLAPLLLKAMFGTVIGGLTVFACGVLIGQA